MLMISCSISRMVLRIKYDSYVMEIAKSKKSNNKVMNSCND